MTDQHSSARRPKAPRQPHPGSDPVWGEGQSRPRERVTHERVRDPFAKLAEGTHTGFSDFQLRLIYSILHDVLHEGRALDQAYAYWFAKVRLKSVEQGFLIRQINAMLARLSFYAHVSGLKRPGDSGNHVERIIFSYCADHNFTLPELTHDEGIDRRLLKKRLEEAREDPLMSVGCPQWLEESASVQLNERWPGEERWSPERAALGSEARRYIRANTLKVSRDELASRLSDEGVVTRAVRDVPTALEVTSNSALFKTEAFRGGLFEQQDAGSQLIPLFLKAGPGLKVVDACAGAGGKTLALAAIMEGKGTLIALDTEEWKLKDLKKRARRAGAFNIETRLIDTTKVIKRLLGAADRVLIDAPCSGTGIMRRVPDSKWSDPRGRFRELKNLQQEILGRYALMARVGGLVVYSTCSILPSEDEDQVQEFLKANAGRFELEEEQRVWPSSGFDGFYMARLRRIGE